MRGVVAVKFQSNFLSPPKTFTENNFPLLNPENTILQEKTKMNSTTPKFKLGKIVATPTSLQLLAQLGLSPTTFLCRHQNGDWGDICEEDKKLNDEAVKYEGDSDRQQRILSAYELPGNNKIWIITEWDRSSTCILMPEEY